MKEGVAVVGVGEVETFIVVALQDPGYKIFRSSIELKEGFSITSHI